ncbi:MAG TPA: AgmX/PglI C-terminal domain-containing protein [Polyangiaceae bacterium]|nr:AgmX/PglI C-terminal domain-containing protein [Polyangiaceae bacterium]
MSDSTPPVKKNGNTGLVVIALLLLLAAGGGVFWKLSQKPSEQVVEERVKLAPSSQPTATSEDALPPPPSEDELAAPAPSASGSAQVKSGGPSGCSASCDGTAGANLHSALRARGGQARGCYERALQTNPQLAGKMTVQLKLSPTGAVCSASIQGDTLHETSVSNCVLSNFRSGVYPAPQGGCVLTEVPLNFVSKQ